MRHSPPGHRRSWPVRWAAVLALLVALSGRAPHATAHAMLVGANPDAGAQLVRAPAQIELYFSEPLEPAFSLVSVSDANGTARDNGDARVDAADARRLTVSLRALAGGAYTVAWHAVSAVDGHVEEGRYTFNVGGAMTPPEVARHTRLAATNPIEVLARALQNLGLAVFVGGALVGEVVVTPAHRPDFRRKLQWAMVVLWPAQFALWGVAAGAAAPVAVVWLAPWEPVARRWLIETGAGALWLIQSIGATTLGLLPRLTARRRVFGLVPAIALACVALGVRIAPDAPRVLWLSQVVWAASAATLAGGLVVLATVAAKSAPGAGRVEGWPDCLRQRVLRRGVFALLSVLIMSAAGIVGAQPGSWSTLAASLAGQVLIVANFFTIAAVAVGAWRSTSGRPGVRARSLAAAGFTVLVVLSTGLLASVPGPMAGDLHQVATSAEYQAGLTIRPARVGRNTFELAITRDGQPVPDLVDVRLRFRGDDPTAASDLQLANVGVGLFRGQGGHLASVGAWSIDAAVSSGRPGSARTFAFAIELRPVAAPGLPSVALNFGLLWTLVGLLAVSVYVVWPRRSDAKLFVPAQENVVPGAVALALSIALGIPTWNWYTAPRPAATSEPENPVAATAGSIELGRALFEAQCTPCHGNTGAGDGPIGRTLNPAPADLRLHAVPGVHTDGALYLWVTQGITGSPMPAFANVLSERDRWDIVNYVRTLAAGSANVP